MGKNGIKRPFVHWDALVTVPKVVAFQMIIVPRSMPTTKAKYQTESLRMTSNKYFGVAKTSVPFFMYRICRIRSRRARRKR